MQFVFENKPETNNAQESRSMAHDEYENFIWDYTKITIQTKGNFPLELVSKC